MQFRNQGEPMGPAYFRNVSGLLLAFVVLSTLAHGISLLFSSEPGVQLSERRFGATIISTVLSPAKDKPAALPAHKATPLPQPKKRVTEVQQLVQTTEITKRPKVPSISVTNKTEFKTNPNATPEIKIEPSKPQGESQTSPQLEPFTTAKASINNNTPSTTESLTNQLERQRNYLLGELQNRLTRYLTYPVRARKRGWQGEVMVAFNINERGQLNNVRLAQSSGYSLLDRSAVTAIAKLKHINLPDRLGRLQTVELLLPVRYELREG